MILKFLSMFAYFSGAVSGILAVIIPAGLFCYLAWQLRIKIYLRRLHKKQQKEIDKEIEHYNNQLDKRQYP